MQRMLQKWFIKNLLFQPVARRPITKRGWERVETLQDEENGNVDIFKYDLSKQLVKNQFKFCSLKIGFYDFSIFQIYTNIRAIINTYSFADLGGNRVFFYALRINPRWIIQNPKINLGIYLSFFFSLQLLLNFT